MKPALFLDRDGVINKDYGYVYEIKKFEIYEDIFDIIKLFQSRGYLVIVVTNQSGIGRGYYTLDEFLKLSEYMKSQFKKEGIAIDSIYYCDHSPEEMCECRKPNIGMIKSACRDFDIDLKNSWMVGDKQSDIDLAKNAKIGTSVYLGDKAIEGASYSFKELSQFKAFLDSNNDRISIKS